MENYISINLNYLIHKNRITRAELGEKYDLTYAAISSYINEKSFPSIPFIQKICEDNNVLIDDFLNKQLELIVKNEEESIEDAKIEHTILHNKPLQFFLNKIEAAKNQTIDAQREIIDSKNAHILILEKQVETFKALTNQNDVMGTLALKQLIEDHISRVISKKGSKN